MSDFRSREPDPGVSPHPAPGPRWRDLDAIDRSWAGVAYVRAFTGVDVPGAPALRSALLDLARHRSEVGRWIDEAEPRWRPVDATEWDDWLDRSLAHDAEPGVTTQVGMERNLAPLAGPPIRVLAGPDWISVRASHTASDGWANLAFVGELLRRAAAFEAGQQAGGADVPWTVFSSRRRDAIIVRETVRRLPTLAHAVRHRRELAGGEYEPASAAADSLADRTYALADPQVIGRVRELRAAWFPDASAAAVVMTGLRAALESADLPACRPGFECLFNTRDERMGTATAWGNWSAGIYLRPADDRSPDAVSEEMRRVRASGLPELAHASLRARARRSSSATITMPKAEGAPRLTMSYTAGRLISDLVPGLRAGESEIGTWTRPNGTESITVQAIECAGRLTVGLSFFPDVWPADVVCGAVSAFLADPEPVLASLPRRDAGRAIAP